MLASIFIRARNEESHIEDCLKQVFDQRTKSSIEVILLDCSSTDRTVELASKYPVAIFSLPQKHFEYSSSLNFGLKISKGEFFVPLSAHSVPVDDKWLDRLLESVARDDRFGASYSRQIPWDDASLPERRWFLNQFPTEAHSQTRNEFSSAADIGREPFDVLSFSNASSCIRREVATRFPFRSVPFAEDRAFALDCLAGGYSLHYSAESIVHHSHPPRMSDYFSIAERATISRVMINESAFGMFPTWRTSLGVRRAREPLLHPEKIINGVVNGVTALMDPNEKNRRRALRFGVCSIGTTIGKMKGMREAAKLTNAGTAPIASCEEIACNVVRVK